MKHLLLTLSLLFVTFAASAQNGVEHVLALDASSFRPVQTDALTGVNIDPIRPDVSQRPCARLKIRIERMTPAEIKELDVMPIGGNVVVMRRLAVDGGLVVELTAKPATRLYLKHPKYGTSNDVTLALEGETEYRIDAALNMLLSIVVRSNVKGASLYLDNLFMGAVGDNYELVLHDVLPGAHTLRLEHGAARAERRVDVSRENISFRVDVNTATSRPQYVVFEVQPKTAVVMIDDEAYTPQEGYVTAVLQNGSYKYRVMAKGYHEQSGSFTVSGAKVERRVTLRADAATVTISAGNGCDIWVNNERKGPSPWHGTLASGTYIFEARRAGYHTTSLSQTITSEPAVQSYTLPTPQPILGSLNVTSTPAMADVYVDGKLVGRTPLMVDALVGQHRVEIRKEGYVAASKSVAVTEGKTFEMAVTLTAKKTTIPPAPVVSVGTYKVGDYYNVDGKRGVVFEVSADGRHGKIVSLKKSSERLRWSSDKNEQRRFIGAADKNDGSKNMAKVMQISAWRDKYPVFAWCASLGEGWYLPAKEELETICRVKNKLNNTLADKGEEIEAWYWSSTEDDYQHSSGEFCAWYVSMDDGFTYYSRKSNGLYVRAVSAF